MVEHLGLILLVTRVDQKALIQYFPQLLLLAGVVVRDSMAQEQQEVQVVAVVVTQVRLDHPQDMLETRLALLRVKEAMVVTV
jgi:hypothetical protein